MTKRLEQISPSDRFTRGSYHQRAVPRNSSTRRSRCYPRGCHPLASCLYGSALCSYDSMYMDRNGDPIHTPWEVVFLAQTRVISIHSLRGAKTIYFADKHALFFCCACRRAQQKKRAF
jgi:hypothetical protein